MRKKQSWNVQFAFIQKIYIAIYCILFRFYRIQTNAFQTAPI